MADRIPREIRDEIATTAKDIDIYAGWLLRLENPDPVLRTEASGKGIKLYDEVARDAHAGSVLQTRYLAVAGREYDVLPASEDDRDVEIAAWVKDALTDANLTQCIQELQQSVLYGFFVSEVMWGERDGRIVPSRFVGKHPRRFVFDMERNLRMITPQDMIDGETLPDRKFITVSYGSTDNPYGSGLGQKLWWPVWFKKNGVKFWLTFLEKYGSPTVVGKYPHATPADQQEALLDAIDAIQSDTGIKIPDTMQIELLEATRGGNAGYQSLLEYFDKQISKAVLGQTATTEGTVGKLGAEDAQEDVRKDILKADGDLICEHINRTLIPWMVDLNFEGADYPTLWIRTDDEEDLNALAARDKILSADIGLPMTTRYFYDTYGIPDPGPGDDVVSPQTAGAGVSVGAGLRPVPTAPTFADGKAESEEDLERPLIEAMGRVDRLADEAVADGVEVFAGIRRGFAGWLRGRQDLADALGAIRAGEWRPDMAEFARVTADYMERADRIGASAEPSGEFAEIFWGPGTPFEDAVEYFRSRALTVSGITDKTLVDAIQQMLLDAMDPEKGPVTLEEFIANVGDLFGRYGYGEIGAWQIATIFRTNIHVAYSGGRYRQMQAVRERRPYWRYSAVMDSATRPAHRAVHGKIFRNDHPFWQTWYPPNGFNCRCMVYTVSERQMDRNGWAPETDDPTGTLFEPIDIKTGNRMPARLLMPDKGWSEPHDFQR